MSLEIFLNNRSSDEDLKLNGERKANSRSQELFVLPNNFPLCMYKGNVTTKL